MLPTGLFATLDDSPPRLGRSGEPQRSGDDGVEVGMTSDDDTARLLLRLAVGFLILLHGVAKLRFGLGDVADAVARAGLHPSVGYLVYVGEVVAPLLVIAGWWTRPAATVMAANMVVALLLGHWGHLFQVEPHGGLLLEVQFMFLAGAIAVALLGAGRFSLGGAKARWN
jgi:putative oxidoreductase